MQFRDGVVQLVYRFDQSVGVEEKWEVRVAEAAIICDIYLHYWNSSIVRGRINICCDSWNEDGVAGECSSEQ